MGGISEGMRMYDGGCIVHRLCPQAEGERTRKRDKEPVGHKEEVWIDLARAGRGENS